MKPDMIFSQAESEKIFFTSDTHFDHENIINFCKRPYSNIEEMNTELIKNWNNTVPKDSTVFHLGDFSFGGFQKWKSIRDKLNGKIILILGNHDMKNLQLSSEALFDKVYQQMQIIIGGRRVILNHYPLLCYAGTYRVEDNLVYALSGHTHISNILSKNTGKDFDRMNNMMPTQYDVGVDFNNFAPISWKEVNEKIGFQVKNKYNLSYWIK